MYGIAAFRSRQQVMHYEKLFTQERILVHVVSTPREVSAGCGLSLQFPMSYAAQVQALMRRVPCGALIGLYQVEIRGGHTVVSALSR